MIVGFSRPPRGGEESPEATAAPPLPSPAGREGDAHAAESGEPSGRVKAEMSPAREYSDPSTPIEATIEEVFAISLDSNPTTGYSWRIAGKVDERVVRLTGTKFVPPDSDLRGAPGRRIWSFKGTGVGTTTLSFEYLRPWEKKPPIRKATFTVDVR